MNHNPFATRYTAPGRVPFLVGTDCNDADALFERLHTQWLKQGRGGAIIGPHGCGKSTLLAALQHNWSREVAYQPCNVALHNGERTLPAWFWQHTFCARDLVSIDGYEQLGWFARLRLNWLRRTSGCGLLVTAHTDVKLPTLYRMNTSFETMQRVIRRLLEPLGDLQRAEGFLDAHASAAWEQSGGNARETLFQLYDRWEESSGCNGQRDAIENATSFVSSN